MIARSTDSVSSRIGKISKWPGAGGGLALGNQATWTKPIDRASIFQRRGALCVCHALFVVSVSLIFFFFGNTGLSILKYLQCELPEQMTDVSGVADPVALL